MIYVPVFLISGIVFICRQQQQEEEDRALAQALAASEKDQRRTVTFICLSYTMVVTLI